MGSVEVSLGLMRGELWNMTGHRIVPIWRQAGWTFVFLVELMTGYRLLVGVVVGGHNLLGEMAPMNLVRFIQWIRGRHEFLAEILTDARDRHTDLLKGHKYLLLHPIIYRFHFCYFIFVLLYDFILNLFYL